MDHEHESTTPTERVEGAPGHAAATIVKEARSLDEVARERARSGPSRGLAASLLPLRRLLPGSRLRPGDWVEVRSEAEIVATLDREGALDQLPFMPEMRHFTGRRFRVKARADRTIAEGRGLRSMEGTVHLEGLYCDGEAHDGCSRSCLLFWKEAWLKRVPDGDGEPTPAESSPSFPSKIKDSEGYVCQATRLHLASRLLRVRHLGPHVSALWNENLSPRDLAHTLLVFAHDLVRKRLLHGRGWGTVPGTCVGTTPSMNLDLEAGERVRVKSAPEILATLDRHGHNRGLEFSREMLRFCGQEFTVLRRCDRIIRDNPPKMVRMKDTVLLEGLVYTALSSMAIPRGEYFFWRECWLERVDGRAATSADDPSGTGAQPCSLIAPRSAA